MKTLRWIARCLLVLGMLLMTGTSARAFWPPPGPELSNFDRRTGGADVAAATNQQPAVAALRAMLPEARIDFDEHTGTPNWIVAGHGLLSDRGAQGRGIGPNAARAIGVGEKYRATKAFLTEHQALFGFGPEILTTARLKQDSVTEHNGLRTVVWEQELDGIAVFEGLLISHTTKNEELVNLSSRFIPNVTQAADTGTPNRAAKLALLPMTAARAVALAGQNLGETLDEADVTAVDSQAEGSEQRRHFRAPPLKGDADAKLIWLPMNQHSLRLCWEVVLTSRTRGEMFRLLIDAQSGEALVRHRLTEYFSDASFRVYTSDSPSPFSPGHPTPSTNQPPLVSRTLVTWSALDTNASPLGWITDGGNETLGNNVDAHTDRNADNVADLPRPQGSPFRTFDFPLDLTQAPSTYTNAAVVDLFYWCNWMHDKLYALGFTEAAGNFQSNNFARGGLGNDAVQADAQDGSGFDNANMSTPSDGSPPRMQMYLFSGPTPDRDGDLDHEVMLHEYTHGLSNRRVGGGVGLSALQSRGMGEGWSDWYALSLLSEPGDDVNATFAAGGYATYQFSGLLTNYYFGIRRYPYCTDMTKNPLTFKDIDPAQATLHPGIPRSPIIGTTADEVHNSGEVWCVTLWEARAELVTKYGYATGNDLILRLVTDGMNLSPANPNFLQARDGILQADVVYNGGADLAELWRAFAKRGMGSGASSPSSSTTAGLVEAFNVPDNLTVSPLTGFTSSGPVGGPFTPTSLNGLLGNIGTNSLNWAASRTATWLNLSLTSGTLAAGATSPVTFSLDASASSLVAGIYTNTVRFTNVNSSVIQSRAFILRVGQPEFFTELFDAADNDLDNQTLTFTPNGTTNFYAICREPTTAYATDPAGGTSLSLAAHSYLQLNLTNNISIYGRSTNVIFLNAEGHLTLIAADTSGSVTLVNHFSRPRVSAMAAHIHPIESGGTVSWLQLSNRIAITFNRVVEYATANTNSFQMELFYDGRIRMTHLALGTTSGLVGLSAGNGVPVGFQESDLSSYGPCVLPLAVTVPHTATEGDGTLVGQGLINLFGPAPTNLTFNLTSSDTSEVTVPATVTVLTGMTGTNFDLTILDDPDLDGVQSATISATRTGYAVGADIVQVGDNETAALTVTVPASLTEGGAPSAGSVTASTAPAANITVSLASSDTTEIIVPPSVQILAGQTSAVFNVTIVNDSQIDGDQTATVTAHVPNWTDGLGNIVVHDNEPTNLIVTLPASAREGNGLLVGAGGVRIGGTLPTNLVVALLSSDTTELTVPPTATILAGQTNAVFNLTIVDDPDIDSSQNVTVTASAPGFSNGATNMSVTDNESPPEPFGPSPAHLATNVIQSSDLAWQSGAVPGEIITNDVYFGTTPTPGAPELAGSTTNTSWVLPTLAPQTTYYWQIVARKAGVTPGPIWRFTTRGLDHFVWDAIPSTQYVSQPFPVKVTAKDAFETTVSNFTGSVGLTGQSDSSGPGQLVTFDDLPGTDAPMPAGYRGLTWSNLYYVDGTISYPNSGYVAGRVSAPNVAFNAYAYPASISSTGQFNFVSAYLTAAWNDNLQVQAIGYTGATLVYSNSYTLSATIPALINFNYLGVTKVDFISSGGTLHPGFSSSETPGPAYTGGGTHFVMDSVVIGGGALPIPITPTNSGNFVNGAWTGNVTVLAPATNVVLRADDGGGHIGDSSGFVVALQNDIGVSLTDSPDPVSTGANVTYSIVVTNIGPASANNVVVTNVLPLPATIVSATISQGTLNTNGNLAIITLGTLGGGGFATVSIVASITNAGTFTNQTFVVRSESDNYLANNSAATTTTVQNPVITINDKSVGEGNTGTTTAAFSVSVSPAPGLTTFVNFATASSTAVAPGDFTSTNGTLTFAPGETNKTILVTINGDTLYELNETFTVNLTAATNATISDSQGLGTILNDDPIPTLSIGDVTLAEGNVGTTNAVFPVTLSAASGLGTTFSYATANGNATGGSDYLTTSGSLTLPAGTTTTNIAVSVSGDLAIESDEVFWVDLSQAVNAILLKREGYGLIVNDDGLPGDLDHFTWGAIASPQYAGQPFGVTINAWDFYNNPAINFTGSAFLNAFANPPVTNILGSATTTASLPIYTGNTAERTQVIYPAAEVGGAGRISALAFDVASVPGILLSNWTIRIKPTTLTNYTSYLWESTNWTVVVQTNLSITSTGWVTFPFTTPFDYDGTNSLMVDFSFYNSTTYGSGSCRSTSRSTTRTIYYYTSSYGNPLTWSGSSQPSYTTTYTPNLQLIRSGDSTPMLPTVTGSFTNAAWTGNLTALAPATNLILSASDGAGHGGSSSPFNVALRDDVSLQMTEAPDPVSIGGTVTYSITVTNIGPSAATSVIVTNTLPATANFQSVVSSQGSSLTNGNLVVCALGLLPANSSATVTIVALPTVPGSITNVATVTRAEPDGSPLNNSASAVTVVSAPVLSISSVSVIEGNAGTTLASFTVSLSLPPALNVSVNFTTTNGSALAGSDYTATNGTLNFVPGQTNQTVTVQVLGDTNGEPNETFSVLLTAPVNAMIGVAAGTGTILNDDVPAYAYLRSSVGAPWGSTANETAMNRAFGTNNWQDLRFETVTPGLLFSGVTRFIYLDGSDNGALELQAFLTANQTLMQNWVAAGGQLFINSAPNEGSGMSFGFGVTLLYSDSTSSAAAAAPLHPIFAGPQTPVGTAWTGGSFGHATVSGTNLVALIINSANGRIVLGELPYGGGRALFGGMTTDNFHSPQPQGANLRANILAYAANSATCASCPPSILTQPASITVPYGGAPTFNVGVSGTAPFTYQWRKEGVPLIGATNFNYPIASAQLAHAGNYTVIVTNLYGSVTSSVAVLTVTTNVPVVINFDDATGLCDFSLTVRLTNRYAALGVIFAGPGGLDGGAIIGECGGFGVTGHSSPNFLGFNTTAALSGGGNPRGPETLLFSTPVANFQLKIGSSLAGSATLLAYNTNNVLLVSNFVALTSTLQTMQAATSGIARVVISATPQYWVVDDISFIPVPPAPVNPALVFQSVELLGGLLKLTVATADASPISPQRASNVWVYASTDVTLPLANWTALTIAPVLTNGVLTLEGISTTNPPVRFFRAIEGPWTMQPLRLSAIQSSGGTFGFDASNEDGSPLTPMRAARMRIYTTTNLALPYPAWEQLNATPVLSNGVMHVNSLGLTNGPAQFFRMVETP